MVFWVDPMSKLEIIIVIRIFTIMPLWLSTIYTYVNYRGIRKDDNRWVYLFKYIRIWDLFLSGIHTKSSLKMFKNSGSENSVWQVIISYHSDYLNLISHIDSVSKKNVYRVVYFVKCHQSSSLRFALIIH